MSGGGEPFLRPFYDRASWNTGAVLAGTSVAVLTYIGFDGISTLSEEVENPRRNILLATVLTCVAIGLLAAVEVYAAQLIWPSSRTCLTSSSCKPFGLPFCSRRAGLSGDGTAENFTTSSGP